MKLGWFMALPKIFLLRFITWKRWIIIWRRNDVVESMMVCDVYLGLVRNWHSRQQYWRKLVFWVWSETKTVVVVIVILCFWYWTQKEIYRCLLWEVVRCLLTDIFDSVKDMSFGIHRIFWYGIYFHGNNHKRHFGEIMITMTVWKMSNNLKVNKMKFY